MILAALHRSLAVYNGDPQRTFGHRFLDQLFTATRGYDEAGRLTSVTHTGITESTGYILTADGRRETITRNTLVEEYGYDNARQVTGATYGGLSTTQGWTYDAAGNRITATTNSVTTNYQANNVNEYFSITGGGFQAPVPSHDDNGNALHLPRPDGTGLGLTWNINNELITATNGDGDSALYHYDALGRRVKTASTIDNQQSATYFLYNGWNVELEYDGSTYVRRMTWGLDLSQTLQGAGGVGGLVMTEDLPPAPAAPVPYFPAYDGNGNITTWVNASGTVVARLRYDAYGNIMQLTDGSGTPISFSSLPSNYGFSTKPMDAVTGLLYYGYRYYDPATGRWPSRDPIEEEGGINLYGFVGNDGVNRWDYLGLDNNFGQAMIDGLKDAREKTRNSLKFPDSFRSRDEFCGLICECNGIYKPTPAHTGIIAKGAWSLVHQKWIRQTDTKCDPFFDYAKEEDVSCKIVFGEEWTFVAAFHSHPDNTPFSATDETFVKTWQIPLGLILPNGDMFIGHPGGYLQPY